MVQPNSRRGVVRVLGYKIFYRIFEPIQKSKGTVLCLHGGPGAPHDYLLSLSDLTKYSYTVVFYDQLGVGKSEMPEDKYIFSIEYGVEEVEAFRKEMKLGKVNLFGSSYGGLLAIAYALKYQRNLRSLITAGGIASIPLTVAEMQRMKSRLPSSVVETLKKYEARGDYENPEYVKASMVFYHKHLCRIAEWPPEVQSSLERISKPVYSLMNGPNEFTIIGSTKYWDVTDKLHNIRVPTLVTGGKYDEVSPRVAEGIHSGIRGSERVTFQKSSHLPFWEEREKYMKVVSHFLDSVPGNVK
jgi:proline iminopeptidase